MRFYSTNNRSQYVSLRTAVLQGLAEDRGLFMPESIPPTPKITEWASLPFPEIAFEVSRVFIGEDIPKGALKEMVDGAFSFLAPLIPLEQNLYLLELFHGPTLAFKDFAARFMARLMGYFVKEEQQDLYVLVATSGDTGSAVAHSFLGVPHIQVIILYPSGKVSPLQEKQLTTLGQNITPLEVEGSFDDCQALVKEVFMDKELTKNLFLTSANSINIARLLPQIFYYVSAYGQLSDVEKPIVISVPSGNFGNLTAGLIAKRMGLPIARFVAATNINHIIPQYLETGQFLPQPTQHTLTNAMDVGNPSNFSRMLDLYSNDVEAMRADLVGFSFTDEETKNAIKEVYGQYGYILDPHGAVGYLGIKAYQKSYREESVGIFLETAHPAKFQEVVAPLVGRVDLPKRLKEVVLKTKNSRPIPNDLSTFKRVLLELGK